MLRMIALAAIYGCEDIIQIFPSLVDGRIDFHILASKISLGKPELDFFSWQSEIANFKADWLAAAAYGGNMHRVEKVVCVHIQRKAQSMCKVVKVQNMHKVDSAQGEQGTQCAQGREDSVQGAEGSVYAQGTKCADFKVRFTQCADVGFKVHLCNNTH